MQTSFLRRARACLEAARAPSVAWRWGVLGGTVYLARNNVLACVASSEALPATAGGSAYRKAAEARVPRPNRGECGGVTSSLHARGSMRTVRVHLAFLRRRSDSVQILYKELITIKFYLFSRLTPKHTPAGTGPS